MSTLVFYVQFTASKVGLTGLSPTVDIKSITRSDGTLTAVQTGASMTELWRGVYSYRLTGADLTTLDYVAVGITADATADLQEVPALWTKWIEPLTGTEPSYSHSNVPLVDVRYWQGNACTANAANGVPDVNVDYFNRQFIQPTGSVPVQTINVNIRGRVLGEGSGLFTSVGVQAQLISSGLDPVIIESGVNARQALQLIGAATAGRVSGVLSGTPSFEGMNRSGTIRLTAAIDHSGNRTAVSGQPW